ncbi:MAG: hypothetical protein V7638_3819 [Acidobacteriota bacterium]|jgi:hypothetical protein
MALHGRVTSFKIDNLANTLTDISTKLNNVDFPQEAELLDVTTFQASAKQFIVGFKDNKISLQGRWDATVDAHLAAILGVGEPTAQTTNEGFDFEYGPEGTSTGKTKYTGKCYLVKFSRTSPVNGAASFTAELQITGDATRSTFA